MENACAAKRSTSNMLKARAIKRHAIATRVVAAAAAVGVGSLFAIRGARVIGLIVSVK